MQEKIAIYQHANKEVIGVSTFLAAVLPPWVLILALMLYLSSLFLQVAIICNHQRSVSKSHSAQMERLATKINEAKVLPSLFCLGKGEEGWSFLEVSLILLSVTFTPVSLDLIFTV